MSVDTTDGDAETNRQEHSGTEPTTELTRFQLETMRAIGHLTPRVDTPGPNGLDVTEELSRRCGRDVSHSQVYPNLDDLADMQVVRKGPVDESRNYYVLTDIGKALLADLAEGIFQDLPAPDDESH